MPAFWTYLNEELEAANSLRTAIEKSTGPLPKMIAVVGGGGKTTTCFTLAKELANEGRRVLVTTTTHIMDEPALPFTTEPSELQALFEAGTHLVLTGARVTTPAGYKKVCSLEPDQISALVDLADSVVYEADGARCLPCKMPNWHEPVYFPGTGLVILVTGLMALGHSFADRCCRTELALPALGRSAEDIIQPADLAELMVQGYFDRVPPVTKPGTEEPNPWYPYLSPPPGCSYLPLINQADDEGLLEKGLEVAALLKPRPVIITRLKDKADCKNE